MRQYFILIIFILLSEYSYSQCPALESYNQGNGNGSSCPNVSGTPYDTTDFFGTKYATIPTSPKTGNFTAKWSTTNPSPVPAISGFWQGTTRLSDTAGPASTVTVVSGPIYKYKYCFYGPTNLPNSGNYTIVFVNPINDTVMYTCSYTGTSNSVTSVTAPTITSQPADQVGCIGYPSTFSITATPGTGGDTLTYQWRKNLVNISGATSSTYRINAVSASDTGTGIYTCVITENQNSTVAISRSVSLTLNKQAIFNGTTSSWSTASNWSTGSVPDSTVHAYISATATNMPNVTSGTVKCKCVTIETGASLTVNGATIEIAGRINNSGTFTASNGTIVLNGTSVAQNIPSSTFASNTIKSLTINNSVGVSLSGTLNVTGTYTPTAGTFTTGGYLTLKSSSSGTANVATASSSGGYISGNVTVERYIPAHTNRAWRLLAPNTSGAQTIKSAWQEGATSLSNNPNPGYGTLITCNSNYTTSAGFDTVMPSMSILAYSMANQSWTTNPVTNTNTKALSSEQGYFLYIRGDRTVTPSSSITGATATVLRSTGALNIGDQSSISVSANKFALIGNPFASAIDFSTISSGDRLNLGNKFWVWDPLLTGSYGLGAYVLFDASTSTPWSPSNTGGSYGSANSIIPSGMAFFVQCGNSNGSLTIRENVKASSNSNTGFKTSGTITEQMHMALAVVNPDSTVSNADGIFSLFNNTASATVDIDDAGKPTNFGENFGILRDNITLTLEARPTVVSNDSVFFRMWKMKQLHYRFTFTPTDFGSNMSAKLFDRYTNDSTIVDLKNQNKYDFYINTDSLSSSQTRFYMVYHAEPQSISTLKEADNIVVYPNPSHNSQLTVRINNAANGNYTFELFSINGQRVLFNQVEHLAGTLTKTLLSTNVLPIGDYGLRISRNNSPIKTIQVTVK